MDPREKQAGIAAAARLLDHGPSPQGLIAAAGTAPPTPLAADAYVATDEDEGGTAARRHRMPNGKWLWIHPLSPEQCVWLNGQAKRHLERLRMKSEDPAYPVAYRALGWVYQAIACCRTGPEPDAPPVWTVDRADRLYRNPKPGLEALQEIVRRCDELGRGQEEALSEELRGFFGDIAGRLNSWSGLLTIVSPRSLQRHVAGLASCFASIGRRGTFSPMDRELLAALPDPGEEGEDGTAERD